VKIFLTSLAATFGQGTSVKHVAPQATHCCMLAVQFTGAVNLGIKFALIASGSVRSSRHIFDYGTTWRFANTVFSIAAAILPGRLINGE